MEGFFIPTPEEQERYEAVIKLAHTYQYQRDHAHYVAFLALRMFDDFHQIHGLGKRERFWLWTASILHDIGRLDGQKNHHKRALKIILNAKSLPFSNRERLIIGSVARYHRKTLPKQTHDHFAALSQDDQNMVLILSAILRIANEIEKFAYKPIHDLEITVKPRKIDLTCLISNQTKRQAHPSLKRGKLLESLSGKKIKIRCKVIKV